LQAEPSRAKSSQVRLWFGQESQGVFRAASTKGRLNWRPRLDIEYW